MSSYKKTNPHSITREEVLKLSIKEKQDYFDEAILRHPRLDLAFREVSVMAQPNSGTDIVFLLGPTGVGKTALVKHLRERFLADHQGEIVADPGFLPIVSLEVPTSGEQRFSWRIFYSEWGNAFQEPMMNRKQETIWKDGRVRVRKVENGTTVAAMRSSIVGTMIARRTAVVVLDEAIHMFRTLNGSTLNAAIDALKSFANLTGVTLVLVGSYDLHPVSEVSAQISRRSALVHFRRYEYGNVEDMEQFAKVLRGLQKWLPIEKRPDLMPYASRLHLACAGCVGILKTTLSRALNLALEAEKWEERHLEAALLTEGQLETIMKEILIGEIKIAKNVYGESSFDRIEEMMKRVGAKQRG